MKILKEKILLGALALLTISFTPYSQTMSRDIACVNCDNTHASEIQYNYLKMKLDKLHQSVTSAYKYKTLDQEELSSSEDLVAEFDNLKESKETVDLKHVYENYMNESNALLKNAYEQLERDKQEHFKQNRHLYVNPYIEMSNLMPNNNKMISPRNFKYTSTNYNVENAYNPIIQFNNEMSVYNEFEKQYEFSPIFTNDMQLVPLNNAILFQ